MLIINSIVSIIISALAGMGIGGGGLLVIYLILVLNFEQLKAQGLNLTFFLLSSAAALCVHLKKRKIEFRDIRIIAVTGVAASLFGSFLAGVIQTSIIRKIFALMLIATGLFALFGKGKPK